MRSINILKAREEAKRFLDRIDALEKEALRWGGKTLEDGVGDYSSTSYPRETGAIRRASMDLMRALAVMRRP